MGSLNKEKSKGSESAQSQPLKSASQVASEFYSSLPKIMQSIQEYQPQFSQAAFDEYSQMLPQYKSLYAGLSPISSGLQEQLAGQAQTAMTQGLAPEELEMYKNQYKSLVGNASSPIGASAIAQNLMAQNLAQKQYGQQLGMQLAGMYNQMQALPTPQTFSVGSAFSPMFAQNIYGQQGYGTTSQIYRPGDLTTAKNIMGMVGGFFKPAPG